MRHRPVLSHRLESVKKFSRPERFRSRNDPFSYGAIATSAASLPEISRPSAQGSSVPQSQTRIVPERSRRVGVRLLIRFPPGPMPLMRGLTTSADCLCRRSEISAIVPERMKSPMPMPSRARIRRRPGTCLPSVAPR